MPEARNAAIPHAVALRLPCLLACAKTRTAEAVQSATRTAKAPGLGSTGGDYSSALRKSSIVIAGMVCSFALPRAPSAIDTLAIVPSSGASTTFRKS